MSRRTAIPFSTFVAAALVAITGCERRDAAPEVAASGAKAVVSSRAARSLPGRFALGRAATRAEVAAWNIDVNPAGVGLPAGSGTHAQGAALFRARCAVCHGAAGEGMGTGSATVPKLIGAEPRDSFPFGRDWRLVKTVGNYWPYATTLYDYIHRAMPLDAPGSLAPDEVYALTAFLLAENGIIRRDAVMDQRSLPAVRMPARGRFVPDDRLTTSAFR